MAPASMIITNNSKGVIYDFPPSTLLVFSLSFFPIISLSRWNKT